MSVIGTESKVFSRGICVPVIIGFLSGCAATGVNPPQPEGLITGTMVLVVTDTVHIDRSKISSSEYHINFDSGQWRLASAPIGEQSTCTYRLRGRRLNLELEVDLNLSQDRVPASSNIREVIIVKGRFKDRDGDFLDGPFRGMISYETIQEFLDNYRLEWDQYRRSSRVRSVVGTCFVNDQPTDGLWVVPPASEGISDPATG